MIFERRRHGRSLPGTQRTVSVDGRGEHLLANRAVVVATTHIRLVAGRSDRGSVETPGQARDFLPGSQRAICADICEECLASARQLTVDERDAAYDIEATTIATALCSVI